MITWFQRSLINSCNEVDAVRMFFGTKMQYSILSRTLSLDHPPATGNVWAMTQISCLPLAWEKPKLLTAKVNIAKQIEKVMRFERNQTNKKLPKPKTKEQNSHILQNYPNQTVCIVRATRISFLFFSLIGCNFTAFVVLRFTPNKEQHLQIRYILQHKPVIYRLLLLLPD